MNTELLRTFIEVYRTRHFGKAAERLFITPSAVSARIRLLEQQLGTPLFSRERNNIQVTSDGQRLLPRAQTLVSLWERTQREMVGTALSDRLAVAAPPSLWTLFLQPWLREFCNTQPDIGLSLDSLSSDLIFQRLEQGLLDLGFVHEAPPPYELTLTPVGRRKLILVSSIDGQGLSDVVEGHYIQVDWGIAFTNIQRELYPDITTPISRVATAELAISLLEHSNGCAYLPEVMVTPLLASNKLYLVEGAEPIEVRIYASYNPRGAQVAMINQSLAYFAEFTEDSAHPEN